MNNRSLISLAAIAAGAGLADGVRRTAGSMAATTGRAIRVACRIMPASCTWSRWSRGSVTAVPVEQCWSESRYEERYTPVRSSTGAALVGGAAGALLGSQFGHGDGRAAATVAGAALGAVIGHQASRRTRRRLLQRAARTRGANVAAPARKSATRSGWWPIG